MALLLPKLRRYFAEFLNHSSLDRLGILYLTTCVGLGYGPQQHSLEAFLDSMGSPYFASIGYASPLTPPTKGMPPGFTWTTRHELAPGQPPPGGTTLLRHPITCLLPARVPRSPKPTTRRQQAGSDGQHHQPRHLSHHHEHGNINPLSIDYACRPRLRSRLTLGGQTWPRNPWSIGGRDSHSAFATHACILTPTPSTPGSLRGFTGRRTLPYPTSCQPAHCHGFGGTLEPRYIVGAGPLDQ